MGPRGRGGLPSTVSRRTGGSPVEGGRGWREEGALKALKSSIEAKELLQAVCGELKDGLRHNGFGAPLAPAPAVPGARDTAKVSHTLCTSLNRLAATITSQPRDGAGRTRPHAGRAVRAAAGSTAAVTCQLATTNCSYTIER